MAGKYNDKKVYVNGTTPAINDTNLNGTEDQIEDNTNQIGRIQSEFGLNGATLVDLTETDGEIDISGVVLNILQGSVAMQSTWDGSFCFDNSGTKLYVTDTAEDVWQFTLSTPYDITTASYDSKTLNVHALISNAQDCEISSDGTKFYVADATTSTIYQYGLSTAYDISTGVYDSKSFNVTESTPYAMRILDDNRVYIGGSDNIIYSYTMGTDKDISTCIYDSKNLNVSSNITSYIEGMSITSDGLSLYILDATPKKIHKYTLSVAKDISTGTYDSEFTTITIDATPNSIWFNSDEQYYVLGGTTDKIYEYGSLPASVTGTAEQVNSAKDLGYRNIKVDVANLDSANNLYYKLDDRTYATVTQTNTLTVSSQTAGANASRFSADGTKFYVGPGSAGTDIIYQYTLSTAWNLSTGSYASKTLDCNSEITNMNGFTFNSTGTKIYVVDAGTATIFQYGLSTAWDISTGSYDSKSFVTTTQVTQPYSLMLLNDNKLYVTGGAGTIIAQYTLSTPSDISTASYDSKSLDHSGETAASRGIFIDTTGTYVFIVAETEVKIFKYTLSTPYDISTGSYNGESYAVTSPTAPKEVNLSSDGSKMYLTGADDIIYEFDLSIANVLVGNLDTPIVTNTEITANGTNIIDLSAINLTTYPNDLVLTYQLDRDSTGDTSPTISEHSITWEGAGGRVLYDEGVTTSTVASLSIGVPNVKKIEIELEDFDAVVTGNPILTIQFNGDTVSNYGYTWIRTSVETGSGSSANIQISGANGMYNCDGTIVISNHTNRKVAEFNFGSIYTTSKNAVVGVGVWSSAEVLTTVNIQYINGGNIEIGSKYRVYYYI